MMLIMIQGNNSHKKELLSSVKPRISAGDERGAYALWRRGEGKPHAIAGGHDAGSKSS